MKKPCDGKILLARFFCEKNLNKKVLYFANIFYRSYDTIGLARG